MLSTCTRSSWNKKIIAANWWNLIGKKKPHVSSVNVVDRPVKKKKFKVINKPFIYELCEFYNNNVINPFGRRSFLFLASCNNRSDNRPKKSYSNELRAYGTTKYVRA